MSSTHENIFDLGSDNAMLVRPLDVYDHYVSYMYIRTKHSCDLYVRVILSFSFLFYLVRAVQKCHLRFVINWTHNNGDQWNLVMQWLFLLCCFLCKVSPEIRDPIHIAKVRAVLVILGHYVARTPTRKANSTHFTINSYKPSIAEFWNQYMLRPAQVVLVA